MTRKKTIVPPIKSQGIKTKLIPWIRACLPESLNGLYYEPFLGSGVVAFNLRPRRAVLSDSNPHIINFYAAVKRGDVTPEKVRAYLAEEGRLLAEKGERHFYEVRDRFNEYGCPLDFLFLSRSCFNGLIRFNRSGQYNVPFGHKPKRFSKAYITKIVNQVRWVCEILNDHEDWILQCSDFRQVLSRVTQDDFVYCDPPYIERHVDYYDSWSEADEKALSAILEDSGAAFILSTWHSNKFRANRFINIFWSKCRVLTRDHFYHVGAKVANRNAMKEALVLNYDPPARSDEGPFVAQLAMF